MSSGAFPTFIVIGAMKCGTTSLHEYLGGHPEIFMSEVKEVNFFMLERTWDKGSDWYKAQFDPRFAVRGESSQNYTKRHEFEDGVAQRIKNLIPDVKLVYLVRDPIDRIVSHYHEALEGGYAPPGGMNAALAANPEGHDMTLNSSYHFQLETYLKHFREEAILVVPLEDLKADRLATMNRIFAFLGVEELSDDRMFGFVRNAGTEKRAKNLLGRFAFGSSSSGLRSLMPRWLKDRLKSSRVTRALTSSPVTRESLDCEVADRLRSVLKPDVDRLRKLTGLGFEQWSL